MLVPTSAQRAPSAWSIALLMCLLAAAPFPTETVRAYTSNPSQPAAKAIFTRIDTASWVGAQYVPSSATNELWWWNFEAHIPEIHFELAAMKHKLGFNSVRMFLHSMLWKGNSTKLLASIHTFLDIAEAYDIKAGFVFFDDCWNFDSADLAHPCKAVKGRHNGCWMQSPQAWERQGPVTDLKPYVQGVVKEFANDSRVLFWEIYNEPRSWEQYSALLRRSAAEWIQEVGPSQPYISCWDDNEATQISDVHRYDGDFTHWLEAVYANPSKGAVITEAGARWYEGWGGSLGSPLEVVSWLNALKSEGRPYIPGVFINWEVMVGNSNTRWGWGSPDGAPEPPIPYHGHLFPDGTPVSFTEAAAIKKYTTGEDNFYYLDTFTPAISNNTQDHYLALQSKQAFPLNTTSIEGDEAHSLVIEASLQPRTEDILAGVKIEGLAPWPIAIQLDTATNELLVVKLVEPAMQSSEPCRPATKSMAEAAAQEEVEVEPEPFDGRLPEGDMESLTPEVALSRAAAGNSADVRSVDEHGTEKAAGAGSVSVELEFDVSADGTTEEEHLPGLEGEHDEELLSELKAFLLSLPKAAKAILLSGGSADPQQPGAHARGSDTQLSGAAAHTSRRRSAPLKEINRESADQGSEARVDAPLARVGTRLDSGIDRKQGTNMDRNLIKLPRVNVVELAADVFGVTLLNPAGRSIAPDSGESKESVVEEHTELEAALAQELDDGNAMPVQDLSSIETRMQVGAQETPAQSEDDETEETEKDVQEDNAESDQAWEDLVEEAETDKDVQEENAESDQAWEDLVEEAETKLHSSTRRKVQHDGGPISTSAARSVKAIGGLRGRLAVSQPERVPADTVTANKVTNHNVPDSGAQASGIDVLAHKSGESFNRVAGVSGVAQQDSADDVMATGRKAVIKKIPTGSSDAKVKDRSSTNADFGYTRPEKPSIASETLQESSEEEVAAGGADGDSEDFDLDLNWDPYGDDCHHDIDDGTFEAQVEEDAALTAQSDWQLSSNSKWVSSTEDAEVAEEREDWAKHDMAFAAATIAGREADSEDGMEDEEHHATNGGVSSSHAGVLSGVVQLVANGVSIREEAAAHDGDLPSADAADSLIGLPPGSSVQIGPDGEEGNEELTDPVDISDLPLPSVETTLLPAWSSDEEALRAEAQAHDGDDIDELSAVGQGSVTSAEVDTVTHVDKPQVVVWRSLWSDDASQLADDNSEVADDTSELADGFVVGSREQAAGEQKNAEQEEDDSEADAARGREDGQMDGNDNDEGRDDIEDESEKESSMEESGERGADQEEDEEEDSDGKADSMDAEEQSESSDTRLGSRKDSDEDPSAQLHSLSKEQLKGLEAWMMKKLKAGSGLEVELSSRADGDHDQDDMEARLQSTLHGNLADAPPLSHADVVQEDHDDDVTMADIEARVEAAEAKDAPEDDDDDAESDADDSIHASLVFYLQHMLGDAGDRASAADYTALLREVRKAAQQVAMTASSQGGSSVESRTTFNSKAAQAVKEVAQVVRSWTDGASQQQGSATQPNVQGTAVYAEKDITTAVSAEHPGKHRRMLTRRVAGDMESHAGFRDANSVGKTLPTLASIAHVGQQPNEASLSATEPSSQAAQALLKLSATLKSVLSRISAKAPGMTALYKAARAHAARVHADMNDRGPVEPISVATQGASLSHHHVRSLQGVERARDLLSKAGSNDAAVNSNYEGKHVPIQTMQTIHKHSFDEDSPQQSEHLTASDMHSPRVVDIPDSEPCTSSREVLARFNLSQLDNGLVIKSWNILRVVVLDTDTHTSTDAGSQDAHAGLKTDVDSSAARILQAGEKSADTVQLQIFFNTMWLDAVSASGRVQTIQPRLVVNVPLAAPTSMSRVPLVAKATSSSEREAARQLSAVRQGGRGFNTPLSSTISGGMRRIVPMNPSRDSLNGLQVSFVSWQGQTWLDYASILKPAVLQQPTLNDEQL